jgi:hypothetical protein
MGLQEENSNEFLREPGPFMLISWLHREKRGSEQKKSTFTCCSGDDLTRLALTAAASAAAFSRLQSKRRTFFDLHFDDFLLAPLSAPATGLSPT